MQTARHIAGVHVKHLTVAVANIRAGHSRSIEARLALTLKVRRLRHHDAVGIHIAVRLALGNVFAGIGALTLRGSSGDLGTVIGWTLQTGGLL